MAVSRMRILPSLLAVALAALLFSSPAAAAGFANPAPVTIQGYEGHAMEPFVSRDGKILFFNNLNDPSENTEIHWAEHVKGLTFQYRGKVEGVNSEKLDGVPSMDRNGVFYFISTRSYDQTLSTVYSGQFKAGKVTGAALVKGLEAKKPGYVVFDAEITPDGQFMYAAEGDLTGGGLPKTADLFLARRAGDHFERVPDGARMFVNINTAELEYAPSISSDGLELFFTRMTGSLFWRKTTIEHATRRSVTDPFEPPVTIAAVEGLVEAPSLTANGKHLFYHAKVDGTYRIFCVSRR
jgi:hypothetical protein